MVRHDKSGFVEQSDKSRKSWTAIFVVLLLLVVVAGAVWYVQLKSSEQDDYATYNGFSFTPNGEFWQTEVAYQGLLAPVTFRYHPLEVEEYYMQPEAKQLVLYKPHTGFTIAMRDDVGSVPVIAGVNVARILGKLYGFEVQSALYYDNPELINASQIEYPLVNCSYATSLAPIIYFDVNASTNEVVLDDENPFCMIVRATDNKDQALIMGDFFTYKILGIIV